jgi:tRNA threonylcarbamoyladenosine biosynthesis protein TsaB
MRVLAFDTATRATTVALSEAPGGPVWELRDDPPVGQRPGHSAQLLALTAGVMQAAGASWEEIDRIAVGVGPGTFTGLRIGIATARALASAREIPLVGVSTLQSLALGGVNTPGVEIVAAVIDARRREVFAATWKLSAASAPDGRRTLSEQLLAPRPVAPAELAEQLSALGGNRLAIGDGAVEFRSVLERSGALIPETGAEVHWVTAINHCELAREQRAGAPEDVRPDYLRLPDAELARRRT